jgi:hypothetical protein
MHGDSLGRNLTLYESREEFVYQRVKRRRSMHERERIFEMLGNHICAVVTIGSSRRRSPTTASARWHSVERLSFEFNAIKKHR